MPKKKTVDKIQVERVAQTTFNALPLLRKRLLHMDKVQQEHRMPLSHVQVLSMLGEEGQLSVSQISKRLDIAKPNITPLVDRLIEDGFVKRQRDEHDRRVVNIILLPNGYQKLEAITKTISNFMLDWAEDSSEQDFNDLDDSLCNIIRLLS